MNTIAIVNLRKAMPSRNCWKTTTSRPVHTEEQAGCERRHVLVLEWPDEVGARGFYKKEFCSN